MSSAHPLACFYRDLARAGYKRHARPRKVGWDNDATAVYRRSIRDPWGERLYCINVWDYSGKDWQPTAEFSILRPGQTTPDCITVDYASRPETVAQFEAFFAWMFETLGGQPEGSYWE